MWIVIYLIFVFAASLFLVATKGMSIGEFIIINVLVVVSSELASTRKESKS